MSAYIRNNAQIGKVIRDFRRRRNLTGVQLGKKVNLSQSKLSKIENGYYTKLQYADVEKIANILEIPQTIRQQLFAAIELIHPSLRQRLSLTPAWPSNSPYGREQHTTILRVFCLSIIAALLQTMEYHKAVLSNFALSQEEFAERMNDTLKRQDLLWDTKRQFHFIFHEAALFTSPAGREAQIRQLDRIGRFIGMPHIKIGIIPVESGLLSVDNGPFVVYDDSSLVTIDAHYDSLTSNPRDIAEHLKFFSDLDDICCYGQEAQALINKAIQHFS